MSKSNGFRVIIAGGGVAGLALANALEVNRAQAKVQSCILIAL
jgi:2-polyprenyl-6-methoxyphenol hydroxylase-like FAD-dependent oxidoreductase